MAGINLTAEQVFAINMALAKGQRIEIIPLKDRIKVVAVRTYHFERAEQETDMAWLLEKETDFYQNNVLNGVPPAAILRL